MSLEKAKNYLNSFGLADKILEFNTSSATVELAAQAVGTEPDKIAKSLTFLINDKPIMILTSGLTKVSNRKFKDTFQCKAKMIPRENVEELIGHDVGGVCPFGINPDVKVYLDKSLKKHETVFPAAGSSNSAIELSPDELEKIINVSEWIDIGQ